MVSPKKIIKQADGTVQLGYVVEGDQELQFMTIKDIDNLNVLIPGIKAKYDELSSKSKKSAEDY